MLVSFLNSFMSYLVLAIVIVVVAGIAVTIGITMAKKKNAENAAMTAAADGGISKNEK